MRRRVLIKLLQLQLQEFAPDDPLFDCFCIRRIPELDACGLNVLQVSERVRKAFMMAVARHLGRPEDIEGAESIRRVHAASNHATAVPVMPD